MSENVPEFCNHCIPVWGHRPESKSGWGLHLEQECKEVAYLGLAATEAWVNPWARVKAGAPCFSLPCCLPLRRCQPPIVSQKTVQRFACRENGQGQVKGESGTSVVEAFRWDRIG